MDELTALARLRADVDEPTPQALAAARTRLTDHDVRPAVLMPRPRRRTLATRGAVGIAAAAAVAAGSFVLANTGGNGSPGDRLAAPPPGSGSHAAPPAVTHYANAAQLLDAAATNALRTGDPALRAGQYSYTRVHSYGVTTIEEPPHRGAYEFSENTAQQWLPASPKGTSYYRTVNDITVHYPTAAQRRFAAASPGGIPKRYVEWDVAHGAGEPQQVYPHVSSQPKMVCAQPDGTTATSCPTPKLSPWDEPTRQSLATLPTDPTALRTSLMKWARALHAEASKYNKPTVVASLALGGIAGALDTGAAPADLRAALFRVAKTIPGITLVGSLANYDGTSGLGVRVVDSFGVEQDLIFAADGTYLGERQVVTRPSAQYHLRPGTVVEQTAVTTGVAGKPKLPH